jgi:hypothetical protein
MHKTLMLALGAGFLAAATLQVPGAAVAAQKGGERGLIIEGGKNKQLGVPDTKNKGRIRGIVIEGGKSKGVSDPDERRNSR